MGTSSGQEQALRIGRALRCDLQFQGEPVIGTARNEHHNVGDTGPRAERMKHSCGVRLAAKQLQRNVKAQIADGRIFLVDVRHDAGLELFLAPDDRLIAEP